MGEPHRFAFLLCIFVGVYTRVWSDINRLTVRFCLSSQSVRLFCEIISCFIGMYESVYNYEWLDINIQLTRRGVVRGIFITFAAQKINTFIYQQIT